MKKFFFFAAAVVSMAACQKEAQLSSNGFTAPVEEGAPEAVQFCSNVKASVATKAQGGVDAWNGAQNLYIYGYQRVAGGVDYTTATPFINNVPAASPVQDNKLAVLVDGKPFYYVGNNTYDFYGYYVDDLNVTPQTTTTGVYVPVELTGGEDVMVAQADPAVDGASLTDYRYAYSAYAARRGVQPTLVFKHQLVRFRFQVVSGTSFETTGDAEKNLNVTGVSVNARNKANLYVAGRVGLEDIQEERANLALKSLVDGALVDLVSYEVPDKDAVVAEGANVLGESLMVIPNAAVQAPEVDTYQATLTMTQFGQTHELPLTLSINDVVWNQGVEPQTQFTAGYSYLITVKVYGLEEVVISAELEPWTAAGGIEIDTDEAPEIFE